MKLGRVARAATYAVLVTVLVDLVSTTPTAPTPAPGAGYHHLGATTAGTWSGVLGRMTVTAPQVRKGTYDFVASRFMVKGDTPGGTRWLEAGWAETGWAGTGRQRVYTFDTNSNRWTFYDQYPIRGGDRIWIELTAADTGPRATWVAWLWWHEAWHKLTAQKLPISEHAQVEQYVEVYVDPRRGGTVRVPPIDVDNVQLRADPDAPMRYWTPDRVPTNAGNGGGAYCLNWRYSYNTWRAGSC
ncbi:MAG TPA: hypothetical protein VJT31_28865 [Rugosimonospora sp.]|nr:hypothetical protein [Rugosimonospora sp.]